MLIGVIIAVGNDIMDPDSLLFMGLEMNQFYHSRRQRHGLDPQNQIKC
jgi:hypothetical protein